MERCDLKTNLYFFNGGNGISRLTLLLCLAGFAANRHCCECQENPSARTGRAVVIAVGSPGAENYEKVFRETALRWNEACEKGGIKPTMIGLTPPGKPGDAKILENLLRHSKASELWLVLIGHGSFDGREAKFNARGPDFTDHQLADWLSDFPGQLIVINTTSASGSFVPVLSGPKRIIISATKSSNEIFYARFGTFFAQAIGGLAEADLDNDDQVSLLESFLFAADRVKSFYEKEGRLATEHSLIEDNGDKLGTRAEWFSGVTAVKAARDGAEPDGERAMQKVLVKNEFEKRLSPDQVSRRDELERKVRALRRKKDQTDADLYYTKLETLLVELAKIYREVEDRQ